MEQKIIVFASSNKHKIEEIQFIFSQSDKTKDIKLLSLADIGFVDDIEETGETFLENALIKANAVNKFLKEKNLNYKVLADDSGLSVDALGGAPGVYSARFAGDHDNPQANRDKLLGLLEGEKNRNAKFVCTLVLMNADGSYITAVGETFGHILTEEVGDKSFTYDCVFYSDDLQKSFGNSTPEQKNAISHRGRAVQNLISKM